MKGFMEEVVDLMNSIMEKNLIIQAGQYPQETKDEARKITDEMLNVTDPFTLAKERMVLEMEK